MTAAEEKRVAELTDELFRLVEESQGHFFHSDGVMFKTQAEFFKRVRGRLRWGKKACRLMGDFLRQYGEENGP